MAGVGLAPCEAWTEARQGRTAFSGAMPSDTADTPETKPMTPLFVSFAWTLGQLKVGWTTTATIIRETGLRTAAAAFVTAHPR